MENDLPPARKSNFCEWETSNPNLIVMQMLSGLHGLYALKYISR